MAFARTPTVQKPARKTFADRYMIKPFSLTEFADAVTEGLARPRKPD